MVLCLQEWLEGVPVPKYCKNDPRIFQRMKDELPVVIQGTGVVDVLTTKWTLSYLSRAALPTNKFNVFISSNKIFQFSDKSKNSGG